jgi:alpha-galactosidase
MLRRGWTGELRLVDIDPDALEVARKMVERMVAGSDIVVRASSRRRELLPGASLVICTVGVGGRRAWERDVFIPREFGIYQPVGDTVMPGGTSRALRMIPTMVDIARDVWTYAPDALFFNYGNPMSPVCRAIRKATGARVVGLCHGVIDVARYLCERLDVELSALRYTAAGMNHLTWFTEVRAEGRDFMRRLCDLAPRRIEAGDNPVSWHLLSLFGAFPAVLDRHVTEFFPHLFARKGAYFGKTLGVDAFSFEETIARGDEAFDRMRAAGEGHGELPPEFRAESTGEHEQVTRIVEDIRNDSGTLYSANLPNHGQVPNLPSDSVVESPCIATAAGLRPIQVPPLPPAAAAVVSGRLGWVETVVDAALVGDPDLVVQALILDGSVQSISQAEQLSARLISACEEFLPQFSK